MRRQGMDVDGFEWKLKPTTFYNQVTLTYHDTYSTKSVKVFPKWFDTGCRVLCLV